MKAKIYRFDPEKDAAPYYQDYELPITREDRYTAMDVLQYVYDFLDTTLSFFSHSVCNHGICGRCTIRINGSTKLACTYLVEEDELTIEPKAGRVIKDLVTR
jgi:succinate dehydrogenase/fumarate reductase-like Fe-S protein